MKMNTAQMGPNYFKVNLAKMAQMDYKRKKLIEHVELITGFIYSLLTYLKLLPISFYEF